jgi:hypothetical protein
MSTGGHLRAHRKTPRGARPRLAEIGRLDAVKIAFSAIGFARECAYIEPEQTRFFRRFPYRTARRGRT